MCNVDFVCVCVSQAYVAVCMHSLRSKHSPEGSTAILHTHTVPALLIDVLSHALQQSLTHTLVQEQLLHVLYTRRKGKYFIRKEKLKLHQRMGDGIYAYHKYTACMAYNQTPVHTVHVYM